MIARHIIEDETAKEFIRRKVPRFTGNPMEGLSVRAGNALINLVGYEEATDPMLSRTLLRKARALTPQEIARCRNLGHKTYAELHRWFKKHGVDLPPLEEVGRYVNPAGRYLWRTPRQPIVGDPIW